MGERGLTSRVSLKAHLRLLLNVHTKFKFPSLFWREVIISVTSKNDEIRPKNKFFWSYEGVPYSWKVETPKRHIKDLYYTFVPNLNFLSRFGGELCKEQTQNMRKSTQKPTFLSGKRALSLKNLNLQNVYLWSQLGLHIKFKLPSSIWWGGRGGTASFQGWKGENLSYLPC